MLGQRLVQVNRGGVRPRELMLWPWLHRGSGFIPRALAFAPLWERVHPASFGLRNLQPIRFAWALRDFLPKPDFTLTKAHERAFTACRTGDSPCQQHSDIHGTTTSS